MQTIENKKFTGRKSFIELYKEARQSPSPAQAFVAEVSTLVHRKRSTVKQWTMGKREPDELAKSILAEKFQTDMDILFPPGTVKLHNKKCENGKSKE